LEFHDGAGTTYLDGHAQGVERLADRDALALSTFGSLDRYQRTVDFRRFVEGVRLSGISLDAVRDGESMSSAVPTLLRSARNLPQMVQYLRDEHPATFDVIIRSLRRYVPTLHGVQVEESLRGRLMLRMKDTAFEQLTIPENTSDGTLKLLAYLVSLWAPYRNSVLLLEEPENFLHHRLLHLMAEDARASAERGQVLVATHSPYFVDALRPDEVWVTYRGAEGYTAVRRASDLPRLVSMVQSGGALGDLWAEGYFDQGDPLAEPS
jgi:predicted ATPase